MNNAYLIISRYMSGHCYEIGTTVYRDFDEAHQLLENGQYIHESELVKL